MHVLNIDKEFTSGAQIVVYFIDLLGFIGLLDFFHLHLYLAFMFVQFSLSIYYLI